jgi:hypothetical protein
LLGRVSRALIAAGLALLAALPATAASAAAPAEPPKRVLIVIVDQFLPEYVERFEMDNVRTLMEGGVSFERAMLGHMAAETVISHNVITSGLFPKHMGWSNEVYRDVNNVLGEGAGAYFVTSSLGCAQFNALLQAQGYPKLDDHLGGKFIAVGQKPTAACPAGHPADPGQDIVVHLGSRQGATSPCPGYRGPAGANVPIYLSQPLCGRFYVDSRSALDYGTRTTLPASLYPLDGNRFAVGTDPAHLGGDIWTADAAMAMMQNETDWKGMLVSLGSVDKMAHMWGTDDTWLSRTGAVPHEQASLEFAVQTADEEVGRIMAKLEALGLRDETLVVVTSDHGGQTAHNHHGVMAPGRDGNFNWYYGKDSDETYLDPQPQIAPLLATGNVDFNYGDGHVATWLKDTSPARLAEAAAAMRSLPDVIAAYVRSGDRYVRSGPTGEMSGPERAWWVRHGQELVDTMAAPYGPDVVGLLRDNVSYGVAGDHGGHQRPIQRIPMVFSWPGLKPQGRQEHIRAVDIVPTVLELMQLSRVGMQPLDGRAYDLLRGNSASAASR